MVRRLAWQVARLVERREETPAVATLVLDVPGWAGHDPGQHVDVRLTAEDGYHAQRSYSIATPDHGSRVELTVQVVADGEVSPFLARGLAVGDPVELRGPVGGWFVWRPQQSGPVLLVGGGSGVVPLMAMVRARQESFVRAPMHLVVSVRTPADEIYGDELARLARSGEGLRVTVVHSREAPTGSRRPAGRLEDREIGSLAGDPAPDAVTYVCGPTGFVDHVATTLVALGHDERRIRTERFGAGGG